MMDINLRGVVCGNDDADILRWWGWRDLFCPLDVENALREANGEDVTVTINSDGGSVFAGSEIYGMLRAYKGRATALVQSRSASAATVIMQGCGLVRAEPAALICVHNPSAASEGDYHDHLHTARELQTVKESILNAYMGRAKVPREELSALMERDIWITADQALGYGLIDEVIEGQKPDNTGVTYINAARGSFVLTDQMRQAYRAHIEDEKTKTARAKALLEVLAR